MILSSLSNYMDDLTAVEKKRRDFPERTVVFNRDMTTGIIPNSIVTMHGSETGWADRNKPGSGEERGVGLVAFINNKCCHPAPTTVTEHSCSPHIELLAVGLRPLHIPTEIPHSILVVVYVPPSDYPATTCDFTPSVTRHQRFLYFLV